MALGPRTTQTSHQRVGGSSPSGRALRSEKKRIDYPQGKLPSDAESVSLGFNFHATNYFR